VFAGVEGTRPLLVEIQALVAPSALGTPRRAVVGWDSNRLSMLLAVLEARCGVSFASHDVYLNVAGGLKIAEPAADLAAAAALLSSFSGVALPSDRIYFGEISLSGAVRAASHMTTRLKEAHKLGFGAAVIPAAGEADPATSRVVLSRIAHLKELADGLSSCQ
jgi:DNA repair protein RadA/Sms